MGGKKQMRKWLDLSHSKPWESPDIGRKIDPDEYMQPGWEKTPSGAHPYVRGSRHNKIGMCIMCTYYVIIVGMVVRLVWVLNS